MTIENYTGLLNTSFDDLEYSPDFVKLPTGNFIGTVTKCELDEREIKDENQIVIELQVRIDQILEEGIAADGILGNVAGYMYFEESGIKNGFAKVFREIGAQLGATNVSELVAQLAAGVQIEFTNSKRAGRKAAEGEEQKYFYNIKHAVLVQ